MVILEIEKGKEMNLTKSYVRTVHNRSNSLHVFVFVCK